MMAYKGYVGQVEYDAQAKLFHGEVIGLKDVITFQGTTTEKIFSLLRCYSFVELIKNTLLYLCDIAKSIWVIAIILWQKIIDCV